MMFPIAMSLLRDWSFSSLAPPQSTIATTLSSIAYYQPTCLQICLWFCAYASLQNLNLMPWWYASKLVLDVPSQWNLKLWRSPLCSHDTQLFATFFSNVMVIYLIKFEFTTSTTLIHIVTCKTINFANDLTFFFSISQW
jgi:hypothetical protein